MTEDAGFRDSVGNAVHHGPLPPSLPPTTTHQEDVVTAGQRRINLIWEFTQAAIALGITGGIIYAAFRGTNSDTLTSAFFLIIGFYFSRTNHIRIGGVGEKPNPPYEGR